MSWYIEVLKKYAQFSGRARRKEYWMFFLFNILIAVGIGLLAGVAATVSGSAPTTVFVNLYQLAVFIPSLAVGVRRVHDTGHSGWWLLVPIFNLVLVCRAGETGDNQYGPDPKAMVVEPAGSRVRSVA